MSRLLVDGETTAARKRIFFQVWQEDGISAWAGSVTGKKVQLSTSGAAEAASTNDIVRVGGSVHYIELTNAEAAAAAAGDRILVRLAASGGAHLESFTFADVVGGDFYSAPLSSTDVADAVLKRDFSAVTGAATRSALNALRALRNRWRVNAGTYTVYAEDDTTTAWSGPATGTPSVSEVDPT
jgi:hypothetical protein